MSNTIRYVDAFDKIVVEDVKNVKDVKNVEDVEDVEDNEYDEWTKDSVVFDNDEDGEEYDADDETTRVVVEEEEEVTFISDDEDGDNYEPVDESYEDKESYEDRIKRLNLKYKNELEKCNEALKGKLNWTANTQPLTVLQNKNLDAVEFPNLNDEEPPRKRSTLKKFTLTPLKPLKNKKPQPMDVEVVIRNYPSTINIRAPPKYVADPAQSRPKKNWFCKNLIQTGTCRFGDNCIFAHTLGEVEKHVEWCRFGQRCNNVNKVNRFHYINVGNYKCIRRHPNEGISNFIKRVQ